ncbi:MAG: NAD(P)/FAD-dependent oxidoreductase [Alkalibacterium sp.]|nr:NAD(P)/FAD-dependent oxidoreductase [Alkalibacterium sp.]MCC5889991.1 NAD(P)/FAD-dependent oxidoreductase [Alkalibacterium sp.]
MANQNVTDCTIIGGGPAGLYAAFYAGMRDLSVRIIEVKEKLGGKLHFYPEKRIWDIGGLPPTLGADVMSYLMDQGKTFSPEINLNKKVTRINKINAQLFKVTSLNGEEFFSRSVIIATGGGIVSPKKLQANQGQLFNQPNVHYTINRLNDFKDRNVVIVGGGNSAIDWANELKEYAGSLHLIHRSDTFRAHESQLRQLKESSVHIHSYTSIEDMELDEKRESVQSITVKNSQTDETYRLDCDDLIVNIGFEAEPNFHQEKEANLLLKDDYYIQGNSQTQTSVVGMYAVGDIVDYEGKVRLIAGAFNDAVNAVNQVKNHLNPESALPTVMSSFHKDLQNRVHDSNSDN